MNERVTVNGIDVGALRPMSEADRWGYYDGSMPSIMVFDMKGRVHIVSYNKIHGAWSDLVRPYNVFHDSELLGWMPVPKLGEDG